MAEGARIPPARQVTTREIVAEIADSVSFHGYTVLKHTEVVDHEKEETRLSVSLLKGNPDQGTLKLREGGKATTAAEGEETE